MNVVIIQPPLVQLNTPYPSGAYLSSFFRRHMNGAESVRWFDASHLMYRQIFSADGLQLLFDNTSENALKKADEAARRGDENTAFNLRRYVSLAPLWIRQIDTITSILSGTESREMCHEFVYSPHSVRGYRMETFLSQRAEEGRGVGPDDARVLASFALADIADYITAAADEQFALIRYAESLAVSEGSFAQVEKAVNGSMLEWFYQPVIEKMIDDVCALPEPKDGRTVFCISLPFPGTLAAGLRTGREMKKAFGPEYVVSIGGGYVNTELRSFEETGLAKYADVISYDRGYGSYFDLAAHNFALDGTPYYKTAYFEHTASSAEMANGAVCAGAERTAPITKESAVCAESECPSPGGNDSSAVRADSVKIVRPAGTQGKNEHTAGDAISDIRAKSEHTAVTDELDIHSARAAREFEERVTPLIVPDYSDIDFSAYPRLADDDNPMHRLWSDGAWLKAYLAHGCYWHRCAFCDVTLDYVCAYRMTDIDRLYDGLLEQSKKTGVRGIHFVDEAAPPAALKHFGLRNCAAGKNNRLSFWGNIRFEKTFTRDLADFLAYSGMTGVSGGIETATENGLAVISKGTDISSIVSACASFKEAGILVHAYMIYGFYSETPQLLIDSMETLRQFFDEGLLDSAFWHKFMLTSHSRVFQEWKDGKHPDLKPIQHSGKRFAENDLRFEGEEKSRRYGRPLETALSQWMHGRNTKKPVRSWFDFAVPNPSIPADFISRAIESYEKKRDEQFNDYDNFAAGKSTYVWFGGKPLVCAHAASSAAEKNKHTAASSQEPRFYLSWMYMGEMLEGEFETEGNTAAEAAAFLESIRPENIEARAQAGQSSDNSIEHTTSTAELRADQANPAQTDQACANQARAVISKRLYRELRGRGLCRL